jgi:hypothetical protein
LLLRSNGELVVAGAFTQAGGVNANRVAVWDGLQWSAMGGGFDDSVSALAQLTNGDIVAGGAFLNADGSSASHLARWNGSTWVALGSGVDGAVKSLAVLPNGDLYAAGVFSNSGTVPTLRIARWNGSAWEAVGNGTDQFELETLATSREGHLLVGGFLHSANMGSVPALKIARWDGSQWFSLGAGFNFGVYAISSGPDGDILAAGAFTGFGNTTPGTANHVARWNGSAWQALGLGVGDQPYAVLALPNSGVVVGGNFGQIDIQANGSSLISTTGIARWDGSMWQPISTGMNGPVYALTLLNQQGDFIAAGSFTIAGGRAAKCLAVCRSVAGSPPVITSVAGTCAASQYRPLVLIVDAHSTRPGVSEPLIYQ